MQTISWPDLVDIPKNFYANKPMDVSTLCTAEFLPHFTVGSWTNSPKSRETMAAIMSGRSWIHHTSRLPVLFGLPDIPNLQWDIISSSLLTLRCSSQWICDFLGCIVIEQRKQYTLFTNFFLYGDNNLVLVHHNQTSWSGASHFTRYSSTATTPERTNYSTPPTPTHFTASEQWLP
jgi:hypothetical protein